MRHAPAFARQLKRGVKRVLVQREMDTESMS